MINKDTILISAFCALSQLVKILPCKDVRVGKTSGQIIAKIGNVEIPRKEWDGLIPELVDLALKCPPAQEAALSTLGFLCDDLDSKYVSPEATKQMLNAIIKGYNNPSPAVVLVASIALENALTFNQRHFEHKPHILILDKIMTTLLRQGCQSSVEKIRLQNLQTLAGAVKLYYHRMHLYFDAAKSVTFGAIKQFQKSPDVSVVSLLLIIPKDLFFLWITFF